jgi:hypothetical protein
MATPDGQGSLRGADRRAHRGGSGLRRTLAGGVHSADVVLNILSRHRDPGLTPTILTPDALRLQHLPIADCARYNRLRRVG